MASGRHVPGLGLVLPGESRHIEPAHHLGHGMERAGRRLHEVTEVVEVGKRVRVGEQGRRHGPHSTPPV
ncbi:hypothetical protein SDC9_108105 [bioreactor metagenome]|uniref:Uncharacterized protein n=1 Tax=bioreactor metagenome TaxID=1076179 RepID=A0A645B767_9ZZZZ